MSLEAMAHFYNLSTQRVRQQTGVSEGHRMGGAGKERKKVKRKQKVPAKGNIVTDNMQPPLPHCSLY